MAETATATRTQYKVRACPDDSHAEDWLNEIALQGYRLMMMAPVTSTHHFTKEQETQVWVVVQKEDD